MARVRANYVFGTLDAALSSVATSMSSPALDRLPVVTDTEVAALILGDPATGVHEVVWVTAHDEAASTATILRGKEGSTSTAWAEGAAWTHGPTAADFVPDLSQYDYVSREEMTATLLLLLSTKYQGVWDASTYYSRGQTVTFEGVLWEANIDDPNASLPDGPSEVLVAPPGGLEQAIWRKATDLS